MRRRPATDSDSWASHLPETIDSPFRKRKRHWFAGVHRLRLLDVTIALAFLIVVLVVAMQSGLHILILRYIVLPIVRPRCPLVTTTTNTKNAKFGVTSFYLPRSGPTGWTPESIEMYQLSESNKLQYVRHKRYTFLNGTEWVLQHFAEIKRLKVREQPLWASACICLICYAKVA